MGTFSLSEKENDYLKYEEDFIELTSCPASGGLRCKDQLAFINEQIKASQICWINKDFPKAIEVLRKAYFKANEVNQASCIPCANLFRNTIINSIEVMESDLRKMATGFFSKDKYKTSYELVSRQLHELKKQHLIA
jgi:hypothetical protein